MNIIPLMNINGNGSFLTLKNNLEYRNKQHVNEETASLYK